jgi:hypothetical protein
VVGLNHFVKEIVSKIITFLMKIALNLVFVLNKSIFVVKIAKNSTVIEVLSITVSNI